MKMYTDNPIETEEEKEEDSPGVWFSPHVDVLVVPRNRLSMFHSESEYDDFEEDSYETIKYFRRLANTKLSIEEDDDVYCLRGLENLLDEKLDFQRQKNKLQGFLSVKMEQERQWKELGNFTPTDVEISREYHKVSQQCQQEAYERGLKDQKNAAKDSKSNDDGDDDGESSQQAVGRTRKSNLLKKWFRSEEQRKQVARSARMQKSKQRRSSLPTIGNLQRTLFGRKNQVIPSVA